jgi:hypothetical protein
VECYENCGMMRAEYSRRYGKVVQVLEEIHKEDNNLKKLELTLGSNHGPIFSYQRSLHLQGCEERCTYHSYLLAVDSGNMFLSLVFSDFELTSYWALVG